MKALFLTILRMIEESEDVKEAVMYEGGTFSYIKFDTEDGEYKISISKEKTNGNNGN